MDDQVDRVDESIFFFLSLLLLLLSCLFLSFLFSPMLVGHNDQKKREKQTNIDQVQSTCNPTNRVSGRISFFLFALHSPSQVLLLVPNKKNLAPNPTFIQFTSNKKREKCRITSKEGESKGATSQWCDGDVTRPGMH